MSNHNGACEHEAMPGKVKDWLRAKEQLDFYKAFEFNLRKEIAEHILAGKAKGAKTKILGEYKLTATGKINTSILADDAKALNSVFESLTPAEKESVRFKPEIVMKEYKNLPEDSQLRRFVTTKPGAPTLALKEVIDGN